MKVVIKRVTGVAAWRWDMPEDDDLCGICQNQYDATCPTCKYPGDDCPLLSGKCQHTFHMHCLMRWLDQSSAQGNCPMCRQKFEVKPKPKPVVNDQASSDPATSEQAQVVAAAETPSSPRRA